MKKYIAILLFYFSISSYADEQYNFELWRTFDNPIKVYVTFDKNYSAKLHSEQLEGKSGFEVGGIKEEKNINLPQEQSAQLLSKIYECKIWSLPKDTGEIGLDGSTWSLAVKSNDKTHKIYRWTPRSGCFYELGLLFIKLSGLNIESEIY